MELGETIRTIRKEMGIAQKDLAAACGLSANTMVNIEQDKSLPRRETIAAICKALKISEAYLCLSCLEESDFPEEKRILYRTLVVPIREELKNDF